jgi:5'-nucleotidase
MKKDRRLFLNQISLMAGVAALSKPMASVASISKRINTLNSTNNSITIYHTNDLHGNLAPGINNMGGLYQIKALLKKQETSGLLLDAGDFLNSSHSPQQQGEVIYTMNNMGYHAAAVGDNELSLGQDKLAALIHLMQFSLVNCNYEFEARLAKLIKPFIIINSGKFKIGITGVGHQVNGVKYNDAIQSANTMAAWLKQKQNCDLVICLSHLGYSQASDTPDNQKLAKQSEHIDMIVSGHDHKLLRGPAITLNKLKKEVVISHAAWDGLMMGRSVFSFESGKNRCGFKAKHFITGQPYGQTFADSYSGLQSMQKQLASA